MDLDVWEYIDNWTPADIINGHTLPSCNKHYDIKSPFYPDASVVDIESTPVSPLKSILLLNEVNLSKVRSGVALAPKSKGFWDQDLVLNSGTNIHRLENPSCVTYIIIYLGQFINITMSRPLSCDKMG